MSDTNHAAPAQPELALFPFVLIGDQDHKRRQRRTVARLTRRAPGWKLSDCTRTK